MSDRAVSNQGSSAVPRYEDEDAEKLGEKLAELYNRRDNNPRAKIDDVIETTRRELRRGPRLRAGEFLNDGQYRLIERIGDSAGDATWQSWDRKNRRLMVIKEMVGPWVAKKMKVGNFLEAARTLQNIQHAGLAPLHEARQSRDGFVYLALDYFEAGRLDSFEGDWIDLLQAIVEVANALQVCHEAGLVHAQVRPEVIFFDDEGGARIANFDLAGEHVNGDSGSVYAAPEMVERGASAGPASDVYSLAMCTLYGLNGGKLPYTVVRGPERFIEKLAVSDAVKRVLLKAVDWDMEQRYASMSALVGDLLGDDAILAALAERALARKRYVIASEHYTALWSLRPSESVAIKHTLGQIYLEMAAWEEAYSCLSSAIEETNRPQALFPDLRRYADGTADWKRVADLLWNQARNRPPVQRAAMRAELAWVTEVHLNDPRGASEIWTLVVQDHRTPARGAEALMALRRLAEEREDWQSFVDHSQELIPYLDAETQPEVQYTIGRAYIQKLGQENEGLVWIDRAEGAGVKPLDMAKQLQEIRARRGQWRRLIGLMRLEADHEKKVHQASRILLRAATIARAVHLSAEAEAIYANMLERAPQHYPALRELARMQHRSGRSSEAMLSYEALVAHYEGKSEEPEASERAADHSAYAALLMERGSFDAAIEQLENALRLQPDNIEALELAGPLYLDTGRLEEGALALERLYTLYKAVNTHGSRLDAALQRADAAWFRGRLTVAMRWYNSVLATVPDHSGAWWGLAKVAMAAKGGHPGTDRAPWLAATPATFTPQEALARLLMGLFTADTLGRWLALHPLGEGVVKAGETAGRAACATVDLLERYGLIESAFFERLREAYPDWQHRIDAVEGLFSDDGASFNIERSYRWARAALDRDFDLELVRRVLPMGERIRRGRLVVDLGGEANWRVLLSGSQPAEPAREPPVLKDAEHDAELIFEIDFLAGERVDFTLPSTRARATIGAESGLDWVIPGIQPRHARIRRIGLAVYLEAVNGAPLAVDGEEVPGWRLIGGETVQLGSSLFDVRCREMERDSMVAPDDEHPLDDDDAEVTLVNIPRMTPEVLEAMLRAEQAASANDEDESPFDDEEPAFDDEPPADEPSGDVSVDEEPASDDDADEESASDDVEVPSNDDEPLFDGELPLSQEDTDLNEPDAAEDEIYDDEGTIDDFALPAMPDSDRSEESELEPAFDPGVQAIPFDEAPDLVETSSAYHPEDGDGDDGSVEPEPLEAFPTTSMPDLDDDSIPDPVTLEVDGIPALADAPEIDLAGFEVGDVDDVPPAVDDDFGKPGDFDDHEPTVAIITQSRPRTTKPPIDPFDVGDIVETGATRAEPPTAAPLPSMEDYDDDNDDVMVLDSLGPAGDAPTPQWLVSGEPDDVEEADAPPVPPIRTTGTPAPVRSRTKNQAGFIEVMSGPARGTTVQLNGVLALGRNDSCEVHLPADPMLSDLHCRFSASEGGFLIMDNGSDRGTMVDGSRISEATLSGGETIMVGSTVLRFVIRG